MNIAAADTMRHTHRLVRSGLAALLAFLVGCGTPGPHAVPEMPLPAQFKYADAQAPAGATPGAARAVTNDAPVEWWHAFGNRELEGLIDRGLSNNPDMRIALNRIVQAKARADQSSAGNLPTVSAPLVMADQAPGGVTVGSAPSGSAGSNNSQRTFQASIRADWRLDVWGEQKALVESADYQLQRAVYERENVQRNLVASIASAYVEYLSLNDRLKTALETEEILSATLVTIEKRVKAGDATLSELEQQKAAIYSARATVPGLEQKRLDVIGSLAFLVGTVPGNINLSEEGLDALTIPSTLPGLPSALLLRRPDLRVAEAQLLAADADLAVARARLLPPMDLSAQAGYSSIALSQLCLPGALFWNVGDSVTLSIFDAGRKKNEQIFSQSVQEEMVEGYARTILQAMKEVESALSSVHQAARRLAALRESIQAAHLAWDISNKVYVTGGVDYLTLLDTQRSYHNYLDAYQQTRTDYFKSQISLYQALGGGVAAAVAQSGEAESPAPRRRPLVPVEGFALNEGTDTSPETFWQVELAGLYHRSAIGPAWRDLLNRYPRFMKGRLVRPRLNGSIAESSRQSWHRLYVAKFSSPRKAEDFCLALQADQQRCRVVSSHSDVTVVASAAPATPALPAVVAGKPVDKPVDKFAEKPVGKPADKSVRVPDAAVSAASPQASPWWAKLPRPASEPLDNLEATPPEASLAATPVAPAPIGPAPQDTSPGPALPAAAGVEPRPAQIYTLQLGAFAFKKNALRVTSILLSRGVPAYVVAIHPGLFAVRVGTYASKTEGLAGLRSLSPHERSQARLVIADATRQGGKLPAAAP